MTDVRFVLLIVMKLCFDEVFFYVLLNIFYVTFVKLLDSRTILNIIVLYRM